jgi:hypothetical protein
VNEHSKARLAPPLHSRVALCGGLDRWRWRRLYRCPVAGGQQQKEREGGTSHATDHGFKLLKF